MGWGRTQHKAGTAWNSTSNSVIGLEWVGVAQIPCVVDYDEVDYEGTEVHGHRHCPVSVWVVGDAQALEHPIGRVCP